MARPRDAALHISLSATAVQRTP